MRVLLAVDDSPCSEAAVEAVLTRPWAEGTVFSVLTVVEPFHPEYAAWQGNYVPLALEAQKECLDSARRLLARHLETLRARFGRDAVTGAVVEGYVKESILEAARDESTDLIVMGSHGRRGLEKILLGSVSQAVVAGARCSVEIVRAGARQAQEAGGFSSGKDS